MKHFLYLISLFMIVTACTKEPENLTGNIVGIVTESGSGTTPLSGVSVSIVSSGISTSTGSTGQFSFQNLEPKTYKIQFMKDGYVTDTRSVTVIAGEDKNCDMQLVAEKKEADIQMTPSSLNFGTTQTQMSVTITNNGKAETEWTLELGDNNWLTASPLSGRIASKKTQSIIFSVNRDKLSDVKSVVVNLSAFGNSFPISVSCAPKNAKSEMKIEPMVLDFGTESKEQTMTIKNVGDAGLNWTISNITADCLSVSEAKGTISSEGSKVVKVKLDREKLTKNLNTTFIVSDGIKEETITVSAVREDEKAEMSITPLMLDFTDTSSELPLTIENKGKSELKWSISGLSESCLSVSETEGKVAAGGKSVLQVKLNRGSMPDALNTTFIVSDGTKQEAITVKGAKAKAVMSVSPLSLDFGEEKAELSLNIANSGNAELGWTITNVSDNCLSVSTTSGKVAAQGTASVVVKLNRATMPEALNATITVSDGTKQERVTVKGTKASGTAGVVVPQGLYTYYKFDGNYEDATENARHGFGANTPTFVAGVDSDSKAMKLSKTNNSSFVVSKAIVDSRDMTVCFWGKDFSDGNIFYQVSSVQNAPIFTLSMSGGSLKFVVTRYNNGYQYASTGTFMHPSLTDGKWHHIALTSDFNKTTYAKITTTLYVDGQSVDVITEYANPFSEAESGEATYGSGTKFIMGGSIKLSNSNTLSGTNMSVDNLRVYDTRRLTATEIKSIYNAKQ